MAEWVSVDFTDASTSLERVILKYKNMFHNTRRGLKLSEWHDKIYLIMGFFTNSIVGYLLL